MARGSLNWFELHIEKIVLGAAAAFAIFLFVKFFILKPNTIDYNGEKVGPGELKEKILTNAEQLQNAIRNAKPQTEPVPELATKLEREFSTSILAGDESRPPLPDTLAMVRPFGAPTPTLDEEEERTDLKLVVALAPEQPVVATGRAEVVPTPPTLDTKATAPTATTGNENTIEKAWVTVASWFPLNSQRAEFISAGYAPFRANPYFVGVDAQRQELLSSGEYSEWEDVALSSAMPRVDLPLPVVDSDSGVMLNKSEIDTTYNLIRESQMAIMQPKFYPVQAGDPWNLPDLPGMDMSELMTATDLPEGNTPRPSDDDEDKPEANADPFKDKTNKEKIDLQRKMLEDARTQIASGTWKEAHRNLKAVLQSNPISSIESEAKALISQTEKALIASSIRQLDTIMEQPNDPGKVAIWFNDDSVEAGKTYRYRLRASLWNRYVGRAKNLADDADAEKVVIQGEWSLPSRPIEVAPSVHFFVSTRSVRDGEASVEVFKWDKGTWIKKRYDVAVGDAIGGNEEVKGRTETVSFATGAIVLDIEESRDFAMRERRGEGKFEYRPNESVVITYFDSNDGRVKKMYYDKSHPLFKQLSDVAL